VTAASWKNLLCENPLDVRIDKGTLEIWDTAGFAGSAGLSVNFDGGPFRLRARLRASDPAWATGWRIGLCSAQPLGTAARQDQRTGPTIALQCTGGGASDKLCRFLGWIAVDRHGNLCSKTLLEGAKVLGAEKEYVLEIEYVPGLGRVYLSMRDASGKDVFAPTVLPADVAIEPGLYQIGAVRETLMGVQSREFRTALRLLSLEFDAASSKTRESAIAPKTARAYFLQGNALFVMGDLADAEKAYSKAIRIRTDAYAAWQSCVNRALIKLRTGRQADAEADIQKAMLIRGQRVQLALQSAVLIDEAERDILLKAAQTH
jgi:hypothetical protein